MTIYYVSNAAIKGYRSSGLIYALRKQGINLEGIQFPESGYLHKDLRTICKIFRNRNFVWLITYPNVRYVFLLKMLGCRKIVLDAGWPISDFSFSRDIGNFGSRFKKLIWFFFDFASFHLSDVVLLESRAQVNYCANFLHCSKTKLFALPTALDEAQHLSLKSIESFDTFTILFRGRYNPESGVETFLAVAHMLRHTSFRFLLLCPNLPDVLKFGSNVILDRTFYSQSELNVFNRKSHVVLGQLANHPRLQRTIPHRAIEAAYSGAIFVTARNRAISELLVEKTECLMFTPGSEQELAQLLIEIHDNYVEYSYLKQNIMKAYKRNLSSEPITNRFLDTIIKWA